MEEIVCACHTVFYKPFRELTVFIENLQKVSSSASVSLANHHKASMLGSGEKHATVE